MAANETFINLDKQFMTKEVKIREFGKDITLGIEFHRVSIDYHMNGESPEITIEVNVMYQRK